MLEWRWWTEHLSSHLSTLVCASQGLFFKGFLFRWIDNIIYSESWILTGETFRLACLPTDLFHQHQRRWCTCKITYWIWRGEKRGRIIKVFIWAHRENIVITSHPATQRTGCHYHWMHRSLQFKILFHSQNFLVEEFWKYLPAESFFTVQLFILACKMCKPCSNSSWWLTGFYSCRKHPSRMSPLAVSGGLPAYAEGQGWRTHNICALVYIHSIVFCLDFHQGERYLRKRGRKWGWKQRKRKGTRCDGAQLIWVQPRTCGPGASAAPHGPGQPLSSFKPCGQFKNKAQTATTTADRNPWMGRSDATCFCCHRSRRRHTDWFSSWTWRMNVVGS